MLTYGLFFIFKLRKLPGKRFTVIGFYDIIILYLLYVIILYLLHVIILYLLYVIICNYIMWLIYMTLIVTN